MFILYDFTKDMGNAWSTTGRALYASFSRPGFVLGVICIIMPALIGRAKLVRWVLTSKLFTVLSRSTYSAYLLHPLLLHTYYFSIGQPTYI